VKVLFKFYFINAAINNLSSIKANDNFMINLELILSAVWEALC